MAGATAIPWSGTPAAVLEDVKDGYVSVDGARRDYGVVVREIDWEALEYELDLDATRAARLDMRAAAAAE